MDEKPDSQLLQEYAEHRSEPAFCELVHRYTDLVYSAALRQVISADAARDVAQEVFADLAAKAKVIVGNSAGEVTLTGWLYRSTRFLALNHLRDERRRVARERQVMEQTDLTPAVEPEWDRIRPVLDEAMSDLSDADRNALLLRFFKNRDFRTIGESLGLSDDAAQKRVSRALEKLRAEFARRGVTTSAVALTTALSANAVTVAPTGLATVLSTSALAGTAAVSAAATATAVKSLSMTTILKAVVVTSLALTIGIAAHQVRQTSKLWGQIQTLEERQVPLEKQIEDLQRERDQMISRLAALHDENDRLIRNTAELAGLRNEVGRIRTASNSKSDSPFGVPPEQAPPVSSSSITDMAWRYAQIRKKALSGVVLTASEEVHLAKAFPYIRQLDEPYEFGAFQAEYITDVLNLHESNTLWEIRRIIESGRSGEQHGLSAARLAKEMPSKVPPAAQPVIAQRMPEWQELEDRARNEINRLLSPEQQQQLAKVLPNVLIADPLLLRDPEEVANDPRFQNLGHEQIVDAWPKRQGEVRGVLARIPVSSKGQ